VDLTFATRLAASSESECQIGTPPQLSKAATQKVRARMAGYGVGDDEKTETTIRELRIRFRKPRHHFIRSRSDLLTNFEWNPRRINDLARYSNFYHNLRWG
jgi:hypothetical protein